MLIGLKNGWVSAFILLGCCLFSAGCEETVEPFTDAERFFTVFGFLDSDAETQYVRVIPLRKLIDVPPPGPIDAEVVMTEMETGRTITWTDSLVFFDDGTNGHVFYADFEPRFGHTYQLEIRRSDGAMSRATTQMPSNVDAVINEPILGTTGAGTRITQRVNWAGVDYLPFNLRVWYRFAAARPDRPFRQIPLNYTDEDIGQFTDGSWSVRLDLSNDRRELFRAIGQDPDQAAGAPFPYALFGLGVQMAISDNQWRPPGDVFDPEILIQPGTLSNVENGFGFFGAIAQLKTEWALTPEMTERLGYPYPQHPSP